MKEKKRDTRTRGNTIKNKRKRAQKQPKTSHCNQSQFWQTRFRVTSDSHEQSRVTAIFLTVVNLDHRTSYSPKLYAFLLNWHQTCKWSHNTLNLTAVNILHCLNMSPLCFWVGGHCWLATRFLFPFPGNTAALHSKSVCSSKRIAREALSIYRACVTSSCAYQFVHFTSFSRHRK